MRPKRQPQPQPPELDEDLDEELEEEEARYDDEGPLFDPEEAGRWNGRPWSRADDTLLRRLYPDSPTPEVARRLRRTVTAVYGRADKLGLAKSPAARRFKPIGSTRTVDGYLYRKVSALPGLWTRNWKPVHVLLWESLHGPVPAAHAVAFKNGDRTDIRPENLELIHRRVLMARNTVHNLPKPLAQTVQLLGALRRKINRKQGHRES